MDKAWALELADKFETGEYGWVQGKLGRVIDDKVCYCTYGGLLAVHGVPLRQSEYHNMDFAIDWTTDDSVVKHSTAMDAMRDLENFLGQADRDVIGYNDTPHRTLTEVIDMLRRYAAA